MSKILEIKNLKFSYPTKNIFDGLNLTIEEGNFITVVGNNTSGKTTLIKLICGIYDSKESIILGYAYVNSARIRDNSRLFGVVFSNVENKFLFDNVYKEMAFSLENLNIKTNLIEKKIIEIAKEFGITKLLDNKIEDLTSSEKQVLLLAISLLHEPKLLLLDDAFSMMDKETFDRVMNVLRERVSKDKLTIILTTSNLEEIIETDYTYVINNGNIVMEGVPASVLKEEKILNRSGLELPFMIDLSLKLEFYDLLDKEFTDMDRMVDTLWK